VRKHCRASTAAQKVSTAEAKRAAAAEAAAAELQIELAAAQDAAADAAAACNAAAASKEQVEQQRQRLQQQVVQLQQQDEQLQQAKQQLTLQLQQLQRRLAECEQALAESERCCAAAELRAESAEAVLSGIRQDVAEWSELHEVESSEVQETRQKLADAETDLGVALQRMAACGLQARLSSSSAVHATHRADAGVDFGHPAAAAAAVRPGSSAGSPDRRDGPGRSVGGVFSGQQQQQQQLPLEVTRQLQWQASEVVRLTGQLQQLQVRLS
jgi:hypothetical protein